MSFNSVGCAAAIQLKRTKNVRTREDLIKPIHDKVMKIPPSPFFVIPSLSPT
jgi:hypothetical protein